jgi:hypothetical protein
MSARITQAKALELIASHGGTAARWPLALRGPVLAQAAADPVVGAALAEAQALDAMLADWAADVPVCVFEPAALVPAAPRPGGPRSGLVPGLRWLAGGALAASVALVLGLPGQQPADQQFAGQVSPQASLGSASGQAGSIDDFALIFTPTADEEELI